MEFGKVGNVTFPITKLMVLRGRNPRFSGKSMMCYLLKHKWYRFERKSWESWNHVFKSLKYRYVYKSFLQHFKTANIAETLIFAVSFSWNFMRFPRKGAQKWYVSNVYWYFPDDVFWFPRKSMKTYINVVVYWSFWSPIFHRRRAQNTKLPIRNVDGFGMRFSKKNT